LIGAGTLLALRQGMRTFIVISSLCILGLPLSARAAFVQVLPGSIERVVAAGDHVAVLRGGTVIILHEDGSLLGRVGKTTDGTKPIADPALKQEAEHILDLLDVAEIDRGTDASDDLLDQEMRLAQRRRAHASTVQPSGALEPPPALAASASDIWIAGRLGIFHVATDGTPARVSGRDGWGAPLAASGQGLLAAKGATLGLLTATTEPLRLIQIPAPARKVALSASGQRQAWTTPTGIAWALDSTCPQDFALDSSVADLAYCGETLVVLLADSVIVVPPDGQPETRARDIQAHRFVCPEGPSMPWLALGESLLASVDQGRRWEAVAAPVGVALVDVAVSTHHLWLATREGLFASADEQAPATRTTGRRVHSSRGTWLSWMPMPKVSVRAAATIVPGGHQLEALAFAAFPLNSRTIPVVAAALSEDAASEPELPSPQTRRVERAVDLRDPDEDCLPLSRRKAVELAMSEPERARSYVTRAGHAAWLPELRVLVSRRYGRSESLDINGSSTALTSPLGIDTVNDIRYEARATWDLGKLVFASEELAAQTQAMHMAELRRDIEATMNRLYFERRGLVLDLSDGRRENARRRLRASEIEAELDAMSAGAFAACVSGKADARSSSAGLRPTGE
jgi:hypothetical protein